MDADDLIFWFSIVVSFCVVLWAILVIRAWDKIDKNH